MRYILYEGWRLADYIFHCKRYFSYMFYFSKKKKRDTNKLKWDIGTLICKNTSKWGLQLDGILFCSS